MRCFIAVPIKEELKDKIIRLQERIGRTGADIKFVEKENLHFTIKFLGDVDDTQIERIKIVLRNAADMFESFDIDIAGVGCFPSKNYIRVLWVGVQQPQVFVALSENIDSGLKALGFKQEQSYVPHLTLGRVRTGKNKEALVVAIRELESAEIGKMKVSAVSLFCSHLSPKGPKYEELFTAKLRPSR